jgi:gamma-glutamyltranspeptidase
MMTQADILAKNEETFTNINLIKNLAETYDSAVSTAKTDAPSTSGQPQPPKPTDFNDNEFTPYEMSEQSPIRPSKHVLSESAINTAKGLKNIIIGTMIFCAIITIALIFQIIFGPTQVPNRIGIVTQEATCSKIGSKMVEDGGNSIDAFIAASFCLSVVNPFVSGIGAGGFLIVRDHKHEKNFAFNCFFKSSGDLDPKDYITGPSGKKSVAIPGELKCLQAVYAKYSRFYWKRLTAPAIELAKYGFKVSKLLAEHLQKLDLQIIQGDLIMSSMYLDSHGNLVKEGDIIKNLALASTLESLTHDQDIFYKDGSIGSDFVNELEEEKIQHITLQDLKDYSVKEEKPTYTEYNGYVLLTSPSPSNGPALQFIMDLMRKLNIKLNDLQTSRFYSNILQVAKLGYALSSFISDPASNLLYDQNRKKAEDYFNSLQAGENVKFPYKEMDTKINDDLNINFVSVNDHHDLMVSYVGTLGSAWGSRYMTRGGYLLNNGLNLFSYDSTSSTENSFDNNKQPRGLMTPIVTYNKLNLCQRRFSISYSHEHPSNVNGDDFALTELTQVIIRLLTDVSMYKNSTSYKRIQYLDEQEFCYEDGFDSAILKEISHSNSTKDCTFHSIDIVMKKDAVLGGQSDKMHSSDSIVIFNKK